MCKCKDTYLRQNNIYYREWYFQYFQNGILQLMVFSDKIRVILSISQQISNVISVQSENEKYYKAKEDKIFVLFCEHSFAHFYYHCYHYRWASSTRNKNLAEQKLFRIKTTAVAKMKSHQILNAECDEMTTYENEFNLKTPSSSKRVVIFP